MRLAGFYLYTEQEVKMIEKKIREKQKNSPGVKCACGADMFLGKSIRRCTHKCK